MNDKMCSKCDRTIRPGDCVLLHAVPGAKEAELVYVRFCSECLLNALTRAAELRALQGWRESMEWENP